MVPQKQTIRTKRKAQIKLNEEERYVMKQVRDLWHVSHVRKRNDERR